MRLESRPCADETHQQKYHGKACPLNDRLDLPCPKHYGVFNCGKIPDPVVFIATLYTSMETERIMITKLGPLHKISAFDFC